MDNNQAQMNTLMAEIEDGLEDARSDFPDAEPGWEIDIVRAVISMSDAPAPIKRLALGCWI